jgi:hypothetical protein
MLDPQATLIPRLARMLPLLSRERAFAELCLKRVWHLIFDDCPELAALDSHDAKTHFEPFLEWAAQKQLSMQWDLHTQLLGWLALHPELGPRVSPALALECLKASASRWAFSDRSRHAGVGLGSVLLPRQRLVAWKSTSPAERPRLQLLRLTQACPVLEFFADHSIFNVS